MEIFKSLINAITSAFFKLNFTRMQVPRSINDQLTAEKLISESPTDAIGYFISGQIYRQQNKLWYALEVYNRGLSVVPPENIRYAQLKKEMEDLSATITRLSQQMEQLPNDILYLIFEYVALQDLLQCSGVCRAWCTLIMDWPVLWRKLSITLPHMRRSTLDPLIRRQVQVFRLDGPMDDSLVKGALQFLVYLQDAHNIQKLYFSRLLLSNPETAALLLLAIRTISPPLKQVKFIDSWFSYDLVFCQVLSSCSKLTQLTFTRCHIEPWNTPPTKLKQKLNPLALSYLKLSIDWYSPACTGHILDPLKELIRHCPNLIHLFLDSRTSAICAGDIVNYALKFCPQLCDLIWTPKAEMPATALSNTKDHKYVTALAHQSKGLRRLVLTNTEPAGMGRAIIDSIIRKVHLTLELLHLTNFVDDIGPVELIRLLANYEFPKLREFHLPTTLSHFQPLVKFSIPSTLFNRCPALEAITIKDEISSVMVDNNLLKSIAQSCPMLCHLQIIASHDYYTDDGILEFATLGGSKLTYLKISIQSNNNLLAIVERLSMLQHLHVQKLDLNSATRQINPSIRNAVDRILQTRGGSLMLA